MKISNKKGFTITEVFFVAFISLLIMTTVASAWIFAHKTFTGERHHTDLRIDMLKAVETMKNDTRLSSGTYMTFYPNVGGDYTAMSMPLADTDANGFLTLNSYGMIVWDKTVVYHVARSAGKTILRRTVIDSWNSSYTEQDRYNQLEDVIGGTISGDSSRDLIKDYLDVFTITPASATIDFYTDSSTPVKEAGVELGYVKTSPGDFTVMFTVQGKNDDSSGYAFGLDTLYVEPAGGKREVEYYDGSFAPTGSIVDSGNTINIVNDTVWSNYNYLEYQATLTLDYIEFTDHYDLWRDSTFDDASLDNLLTGGNDHYLKIETPADRELILKEDVVWHAFSAADDTVETGRDGDLPGYPIAIRTIVDNSNIDTEGLSEGEVDRGDMVRVKLKSSSENPLRIDRVYITRRDGTTGEDGLPNQSPGSLAINEYHRHQQLYFQDSYDGDDDGDTTEIMEAAWLPSSSEIWSEWIAFPLTLEDSSSNKYDYFITLHVPDLGSVSYPASWGSFSSSLTDAIYWQGSSTNTYYIMTGDYTVSGTPDWTSLPSGVYTVETSYDIFIAAEIDTWRKNGSVESRIFDTGMTSPVYNELEWSESSPSGTEVTVKARSSSNEDMTGASDWSSVTGSTTNPTSLSIGSGRYLQYMAEVVVDPFWETQSGSTAAYSNYISDQVNKPNDYEFPEVSGEPYVSGVYSAWIDDVEIDWPGTEDIGILKADIVKKNDYGKVSVRFNGADVVNTLTVNMGVTRGYQGRTLSEEATFEIEPRNTDK